MAGLPQAGPAPVADTAALAGDCADRREPGHSADRRELADRAVALEAALDTVVAGPAEGSDEGDAEQVAADLGVSRSTSLVVVDSIDYNHFHHKSYLTSIHSLFRFIYKDVPLSDAALPSIPFSIPHNKQMILLPTHLNESSYI